MSPSVSSRQRAGRRCAAAAAILLGLLALGCQRQPPEPIHLGLIAGLTGRTADLGTGGRNGVQLAVEQANAAGGINGRKIRLTIKDDASNIETAKQVAAELVGAKVVAIVGPMTSAVAVAVAPIATEAGILMMAGTVTTKELAGRDDQFFRAIATTEQHAATMAEYLFEQRKVRSATLLVNLLNRAYTESWAADFTRPFELRGGKVRRVEYTGGDSIRFDELARQLLAGAPDAVILVTHTLDAANIATQLAKLKSRALHVTSEWAGTGKLIELGGKDVEGFVVPQYLDPTNRSPAYLAFRDAYQQRFREEAGYPAMAGYNATNIVLRALKERRAEEALKQTLLRIRSFDTTQEQVRFDDFGDVRSTTFLMEIRAAQYVPVHRDG